MSKPYKEFEPAWVKEPAPKDSYRSVFRWGDPDFVKYPKESLYKMMKEKPDMTRCGCARNALTACRMWWCIRIPRSR